MQDEYSTGNYMCVCMCIPKSYKSSKHAGWEGNVTLIRIAI